LSASGATSYTWTGGLASITNPTTGVLTTTTTYTVTGTANGCSKTAVATVTVTPLPSVTVNSPTICAGQTASLSASGATSYTWTGGLASISNPTTPALTTTTTYTVTGTTSGCTGTAVSTITVKRTQTTNITKTICLGDSVKVGNQTFNTTGLHSVILNTFENCDSTVNLNLTVTGSLTPSVTIIASKNNICLGEQVVFTATATSTGSFVNYQWFVNGSPVGINNPQFSTNTLNNGDLVSVSISTSGSCLTSNTAESNIVSITVNSVSFLIPNIEYCKGEDALVDLNITSSDYNVFWKNGTDTVTTTNSDNLTINNTVSGNLLFTIRFGNSCTKSGIVPVKVNQLPVINAVVDKADVKYEEQVQLNVNGNGSFQYNWMPEDLLNADSIKNPTSVIKATTLFIVHVKDANDCENSDSVLVRLINECTNDFIHMPTAFSPNSDGINDCFGILSPPLLTDYKLVIFDRWGEKVFETNNKDNCWDGLYKGTFAQSDTYAYIVSFKCYNGTNLSKKGTITILR
ncbi:MAG TPA: gliding motility-associated C-terminal domain-containing protein, partial [Bacteroidia bacterium]|nr:gliding motility-associated C-terminal domain-containing protein [Bacteroidia bacterium]